jgi:hypothetical protein
MNFHLPHFSKPALDKKKLIITGITTFISILLISGVVFLFLQYSKTKSENAKLKAQIKTNMSQSEVRNLTETINKFIELPQNEEPTLATITDKEKLNGQTFFNQAQNGDRLLIYAQARKVYLYRPSTNKIIDIAPISTDQTQTPSPTAAIKK